MSHNAYLMTNVTLLNLCQHLGHPLRLVSHDKNHPVHRQVVEFVQEELSQDSHCVCVWGGGHRGKAGRRVREPPPPTAL